MPWFPVDDSFHSHPKVRATSPAALGLWVLAGSWSMCYLTDGRIKDTDLPLLLPDSATLADELVASRLWRRTRGGYVFNDWLEWGGKRTARQIREMRAQKAAAGRLGGLASGNARRSKRSKQASKREAGASVVLEPPALPSPAQPSHKPLAAEAVNSNLEVTRAPPFLPGLPGLPSCQECGAVLDPDGTCFACRTPQPARRAAR